jgi:hypothetical protein
MPTDQLTMRWKLLSDWPAGGNTFVPAGEILEAPIRRGTMVGPPTWNGSPLPTPLPLEASPLDQPAADYMSRTYPHFLHRIIPGAPGVVIRKFFNV